MSVLWPKAWPYQQVGYVDEADLENAILEVETVLFDKNRIYLNVEKKIGAKDGQRNIPDGIFLT